MEDSPADAGKNLDVFAGVLIRCFIGGMALLMVWFFAYVSAGDWIYGIHSKWFQVSRQTFDAIHYSGMAFTKILLFLFFLLPYIAIRLMTKRRD